MQISFSKYINPSTSSLCSSFQLESNSLFHCDKGGHFKFVSVIDNNVPINGHFSFSNDKNFRIIRKKNALLKTNSNLNA